MNFTEIQKIVEESIEELFTKDKCLIEIDVSERAITHKLAGYIQNRIQHLDVDCEYNRSVMHGSNVTKKMLFL